MVVMAGALSALLQNPPQTHFESQEKGEEIVFLLRRHWVTNVGWLLRSLLLLFVPLVVVFLFREESLTFLAAWPVNFEVLVLLLWYLLVLGYTLEAFLTWYFNVYIVTSRRVVDIDFWGLFYKNVSETPISNVQDVTYTMSGVVQTVFNYGTICIQTAAEQREFEFEDIPNPGYVHDRLTDLVARAAKR